ncbi:MAG TPA: SRPBCC domain-containing protein [Myxococcaceae bacterium]|jgi:uncharacterized protein YndB with AHSA1/START domain
MITRSVVLPLDPGAAFTLFTARIGEWWPPDRRHTKDPASQIFLLPTGRFYEQARTGEEVDLGRVRSWEPPRRIVLDFFIATGPDRPTEVEITFVARGTSTEVVVAHRPTADSAALWVERAPKYERSWEVVLNALARATG